MNEEELILAIDQGTTSSRAIVFNKKTEIIAVAQEEFKQYYPQNAWVEHDPEDIWQSTLRVSQQVFNQAEAKGGKVVAIGITNQRETVVLWDRETGIPVYKAIVWQDRRTADFCQKQKELGLEAEISKRTGLLIDPYFSASKLTWLFENNPGLVKKAESGKLAFGTIDCFLLWRLTEGKVHATDATNASRTNLYNIHQGDWDDELLRMFSISKNILPEVKDSSAEFGFTDKKLFGRSIPILGMAGDQQAASFGQCCFSKGETKSTYGTGCFALINTGDTAVQSQHRLLSTLAIQLNGKRQYALEGSIFIAGAAIQWVRDELGFISHAADSEALARQLDDNQGVYLVPAFTGLGAPHWDPNARGAIHGLTRASGRAHIVRAALESVAYQTQDLFAAMAADASFPSCVRVDGGMVANNWFMQFLADITDTQIERPAVTETTALGAAFLAGLQYGLYSDLDELRATWRCDTRCTPKMDKSIRDKVIGGWNDAVKRVVHP